MAHDPIPPPEYVYNWINPMGCILCTHGTGRRNVALHDLLWNGRGGQLLLLNRSQNHNYRGRRNICHRLDFPVRRPWEVRASCPSAS